MSKGASGERKHQYQNKLKQDMMGHEVLCLEYIKNETGLKVKNFRKHKFEGKKSLVFPS